MNVHDRLESDHTDLDRLLANVFAALGRGGHAEVYRTLDFFWARLAMHIRAEHLRLFPAVLSIRDAAWTAGTADVPADLAAIIDGLHADHDFFMRSLARAIKALRLVPEWGNEAETLSNVREVLEQVEGRLAVHNRIEEDQIYPLAGGGLFGAAALEELSRTVHRELENLPRRFAAGRGSER